MKYEIVNNICTDNHKFLIESFLGNCDEFFIISPFLSSNFNFFPFKNYCKHLKKIILITTLEPNTSDQIKKVTFFDDLLLFGLNNNINIDILIDNKLHAKIYIFKNSSKHFAGIVTSANFTQNGLINNNEWGVSIEDPVILESIEKRLLANVIFERITRSDVDRFIKKIANIPPTRPGDENKINLISEINLKSNPLNLDSKTIYWLKPIGTSQKPIPWGQPYDRKEEYLHFSDKYPSGVKIGHIIIAYAVAHKNILSIYRVNSDILIDNNNTRYPYYIIGENLSPFYGSRWSDYDITISNQKDEVLSKYLFNITPSGNNSYGSLMYGADKLKLTSEFADYLIKKITKLDCQIAAMIDN